MVALAHVLAMWAVRRFGPRHEMDGQVLNPDRNVVDREADEMMRKLGDRLFMDMVARRLLVIVVFDMSVVAQANASTRPRPP